MINEIDVTVARPVVLSPHPLQRVGAFVLATLAGVQRPEEISDGDLTQALQDMESDLLRTASLQDSKAPGGFWLKSSHLLWPNSPLSHPSRSKKSVTERVEWLKDWWSPPGPGRVIGVPCAMCGRDACGYFGKVDVPLAAGVNYRNTTARGHEGMALCRGCLASFHALPFGCAISRGRAAALHSWDDKFLKMTVARQVGRMRREADVAAGRFGASRPNARQVAALYEVRAYDKRFVEGVELIVFKNGNQEQQLDSYEMDQPLAEWLRLIRYDQRFADGWRYLIRAHHGPKVPGLSSLARNLFGQPQRIVATACAYLTRLADEAARPAGETPALAVIIFDYATRVLNVNNADAEQIRLLAANVAAVAGQDKSGFQKFAVAARKVGTLQQWLRRQAVGQVLYDQKSGAFITERQWLLLFDSGTDGFLNRDLLLISTLEQIHSRNPEWRTDDPEARKEIDDNFDSENEADEGEAE
jgi:hypothetical protein